MDFLRVTQIATAQTARRPTLLAISSIQSVAPAYANVDPNVGPTRVDIKEGGSFRVEESTNAIEAALVEIDLEIAKPAPSPPDHTLE